MEKFHGVSHVGLRRRPVNSTVCTVYWYINWWLTQPTTCLKEWQAHKEAARQVWTWNQTLRFSAFLHPYPYNFQLVTIYRYIQYIHEINRFHHNICSTVCMQFHNWLCFSNHFQPWDQIVVRPQALFGKAFLHRWLFESKIQPGRSCFDRAPATTVNNEAPFCLRDISQNSPIHLLLQLIPPKQSWSHLMIRNPMICKVPMFCNHKGCCHPFCWLPKRTKPL